MTFAKGEDATALGRVFLPVLLLGARAGDDREPPRRFRVVLSTYVMRNLSVPMFHEDDEPDVGH